MTAPRARILVCDDEPAARRGAVRALGEEAYEFSECENGQECLERLAAAPFDLVLLDLRMPVLDGRAALARIVERPSPPPVVVLTADASIQSAIEAVRAGAADYVAKPYEIEELRFVVRKTLDAARLAGENRRLRAEVTRLGGGPLLGESPPMRELLLAIERVAPTSASVLITGETGTGKERVARLLHEKSGRAASAFVTMNCAAIPETLVESELFGHRRGAFTGADRDREGKFQQADRGTLFLDEVGDMPLAVQAKLLRALAEGVVEPLGGGKPVRVDVRVLAATHRDLKRMAGEGRFREDLMFRLRVVDLALPALRDRAGDVARLARGFVETLAGGLRLDPDAEAALAAYPWPGNVRELRNAIERAAIFCRDGVIRRADLPPDVRGEAGAPPAAAAPDVSGSGAPGASLFTPGEDFATAKRRVIERFERAILAHALAAAAGNVSAAARALGLHRQNLQAKLRELGLDAQEFKG